MPTDEEIAAAKAAEEAAAKAVAEKPVEGTQPTPDGGLKILSAGAYKRIKDDAAAKGERRALEKMARESGFGSVEEFQKAAKGFKAGTTTPKPAPAPQQNGQQARDPGRAPAGMSNREKNAWDKERVKILADFEVVKKQSALNDKKYRKARKDLENKETEMALREAAAAVGIRDLDYAVRLLEKHVENKEEKDLAGFDEVKFFEGLRTPHPYLFGERVTPAHTGTTAQPPVPPKPGDAAAAHAQNGKFDARSATAEEVQKQLAKRGIQPGT